MCRVGSRVGREYRVKEVQCSRVARILKQGSSKWSVCTVTTGDVPIKQGEISNKPYKIQ